MPATGPSLLLRGVRKAFADVVAVDGLDLEVKRGECFGLLGQMARARRRPLKFARGLTAPDAGTVAVLGLNWATGANGTTPAYRHSIAGDPVSRQANGGGDTAALP